VPALYAERFFDLQLRFARRVADVAPLPFPQAVLRYTAIYRTLGLRGNFVADDPVWQAYLHGLGDTGSDAAWTQQVCRERYHQIPKLVDGPHWGCFAYHSNDDQRAIGLHFLDNDASGLSPLSLARRPERLVELRSMFAHIKQAHPDVRYVTGGSWLYNWEAYLRLFPMSYCQSVRPAPPRFQFRSLWGQFLRRDGEVREDLAAQFIERFNGLHTVASAGTSIPYQVLTACGEIWNFYAFYNV
jgi:hypothetical protein